jgi:hypothetical protein
MKKLIIILCILGALVFGALWSAKMMLMPILTGTLNTYLKKIDTPYLTIRFDKAEDTCWLHPCLQIQNLYIRVLDKEFHGGTVAIEVPYKWPMGIDIKSLPSDTSNMTINASLNENTLNVQKLNITSGDFSADLNGWFDTQTMKFNADMNTHNLATFITPYIPKNMQFISNLFLSDNLQKLKLSDKDGWLTIGGFPVFPLDITILSGFLNPTSNTNPVHNLPTDLNNLETLFNKLTY